MRKPRFRPAVVGIAALLFALHAARAAAEPIAFSGFLSGDLRGAQVFQDLELTFPDFKVAIILEPRLTPGFCIACGSGSAVPFTQTTGVFSAHSPAIAGRGTTDADVTGMLSFVGPTDFVNIDPATGGDLLSSAVQVSGFLRITQPNRVLFDGTLVGSGLASVLYENRFGAGPRLGGYQYAINGVAATPEPASLLLVSSGVAWLASRRRFRASLNSPSPPR
jgi:hypothetical protein